MPQPAVQAPASESPPAGMRPRAAPAQPVLEELVTAWQRNPKGVAAAMLAANLVLFAAACLLFARLTTGSFFDGSMIWDAGRRPLGELFTAPISIYQSPTQGLVLALLLTVLTAVAILIGQFYGTIWGWLCAALVGVLAHLPLLAAVAAVAVWVATTPLLQMRNRFASGAVAMLLPAAAMWISTAAADSSSQAPMERAFRHFPWVAAVGLAVIVLLVFWTLARLLNYRAGVGTAGLALLVVGAVALFHFAVGWDELDFRLLDDRIGLDSPVFRARDLTRDIDDQVRLRAPAAGADRSPVSQPDDAPRAEAITRVQAQLEQELAESKSLVARTCNRFLRRHPGSDYRPYVLFLLARSQDMRTDPSAVATRRQSSYDETAVSADGRETWQRLLAVFPRHPLAVLARTRFAQWHIAQGHAGIGLYELRRAGAQLSKLSGHPKTWRPPHAVLTSFNLRPREPLVMHLVNERVRPVLDRFADELPPPEPSREMQPQRGLGPQSNPKDTMLPRHDDATTR